MPNEQPTQEQLLQLWKTCEVFVEKNKINCEEAIYQTDRVILNAYDFLAEVVGIVGYLPDQDALDIIQC